MTEAKRGRDACRGQRPSVPNLSCWLGLRRVSTAQAQFHHVRVRSLPHARVASRSGQTQRLGSTCSVRLSAQTPAQLFQIGIATWAQLLQGAWRSGQCEGMIHRANNAGYGLWSMASV